MESNLINCTTSVGSGHNWTCFVVHYEAEVTTAAALNMSRFGELGLDEYPLLTAYDPAYELRYGLLGTVLLSVAYTLIFIVGLLGNISVVIVVKKSSMMRSPTNRFIVNLAYADLLVNFLCLPFTLIGNLFPAWILGVFFCKTVSYMQGVSVSASVNTLMAISIERCVAISFPISGTITTRQYRVIVTIIWTIALSINLPWLFVFTLKPIGIPGSSAQICTELWPSPASESWYFLFANLFLCYLGPLSVISICYIIIWKNVAYRKLPRDLIISRKNEVYNRSKVKVIKMVFVVIVTFTLSWLPLYAIFCFVKFAGDLIYDESVQSLIFGILPVAQWLGAANSCINPVLYAFMNRKFRAGFSHLFRTCCTADDDDWDLRTTVRSDETREQALRRIRSEKLSIRNGGHTGFGSVHVTGPMRYSQSTRLPQIHRVD
ncbi:neuropeptide SIFamide receptor-like isoform X1 [Toxorhynchites rutilus septentrionalis]|uniref:neuropeptide SIFamide receptor-like isoform X1 n=1 Tax=Toxorhynchites rutilus septentrionalis TaxID=329112 RepID=UPI002478FE5C|nr:neuropeptide SIFamide receptor-like isoform X1 [Toxorhynchites rutilus septentrionalis]XP_055639484.1 neuropeptide SIFamide receptor-like isoform X1 [Toxorhynchites rutilus septentrionalis]